MMKGILSKIVVGAGMLLALPGAICAIPGAILVFLGEAIEEGCREDGNERIRKSIEKEHYERDRGKQ